MATAMHQKLATQRGLRTAFTSVPSRVLRNSRIGVRTKAYIEPSTTFAVTQQAIAYALVLGGDLYLERNSINAPDVKPVAAGAGATMLAVGILNSGVESLTGVALVVGLLASGAMMVYHAKRTADAKDDGTFDWPGPKAPPAILTLISFFALSVFAQGIRAEICANKSCTAGCVWENVYKGLARQILLMSDLAELYNECRPGIWCLMAAPKP